MNLDKNRLAIGYYIVNGKLISEINYKFNSNNYKKILLKEFDSIFPTIYELFNSAYNNTELYFRNNSNWIIAEEICRRYIYDNLLTDSDRLMVNMGGEYGED